MSSHIKQRKSGGSTSHDRVYSLSSWNDASQSAQQKQSQNISASQAINYEINKVSQANEELRRTFT